MYLCTSGCLVACQGREEKSSEVEKIKSLMKRERERHFIALTALYFAPIEKSENVHGFVHNADLVFRR